MRERYTVNSMFCDMINNNCTAVKNHKCFYADCNTCEFMQKAWNKLAHYEDLEEQGRLIELPCKVGDTVYSIVSGKVNKSIVCNYLISKSQCFLDIEYQIRDVFYNDGRLETIAVRLQYGKYIFTSRAEAEAKLKEMSSSENPNK